MFACVTHGHLICYRMSSLYNGTEHYNDFHLISNLCGLNVDKFHKIHGSYLKERIDVDVRTTNRFYRFGVTVTMFIDQESSVFC